MSGPEEEVCEKCKLVEPGWPCQLCGYLDDASEADSYPLGGTSGD